MISGLLAMVGKAGGILPGGAMTDADRKAGLAMDEAVAKERTSTGGAYIWFHYKTQFAAQGRLHVIQVEVPVPVDASAEERERLLEEALSGLDQFSTRLEQRIKQVAVPSTMPEASPTGDESGRPPSSHLASPREFPQETRPVQRPPSAPAASATSQRLPSASQLRRRMAPTLPSTPGVFGNLNSDLTLPQFLQILRDNFNMDSKQAMKLLGVRSLSNLNLREALDQLRYLVAQRSQATSPSMPGNAASLESAYPDYPAVFSQREWHQGPAREKLVIEAEEQEQEEAYQEPLQKERAGQSSAHEAFYDESDIDEEYQKASSQEESAFHQDIVYEDREYEDIVIEEEENGMEEERGEWSAESQERRQLSVQERVHARTLLNKLREVRGNTPVSQARLAVLWNVIGDQISEDELRELIGRIWGVTTLKQLSIDQVEALIAWAKQDDFECDVAMILALN